MKAIKLLLATALLAGLATLSYAGASSQSMDQQARNRQAQTAKVDSQAKAQPVTQVATACMNSCACAAMKKS